MFSTSLCSRLGISSIDFRRNSCGTFVRTCSILSCNLSKLDGFVRYTSSFAHPHKKKSHGVRFGLRAGQSYEPRRPIHRPGCSSSQERTVRAKYGGAPSCMKKILSKWLAKPDCEAFKVAFCVHCVPDAKRTNDTGRSHTAPNNDLRPALALFSNNHWIVRSPVMAIVAVYKSSNVKNDFITP